ncbi:MAG: hypothetical protein OHK0029_07140 [Armatimonadaceae bacterium]
MVKTPAPTKAVAPKPATASAAEIAAAKDAARQRFVRGVNLRTATAASLHSLPHNPEADKPNVSVAAPAPEPAFTPTPATPAALTEETKVAAIAAEEMVEDTESTERRENEPTEAEEAKSSEAETDAKAAARRASLERASRVIRTALSSRGVPYRMGATGRGAFDCSGFVQHVFAKQGKKLPRTAAQQYQVGKAVAKTDLRPGDLVFFKNTYKRGISHVGIYIGNGQFIHASSGSGQVTVSALSDAFYVNHWAGAKRVD